MGEVPDGVQKFLNLVWTLVSHQKALWLLYSLSGQDGVVKELSEQPCVASSEYPVTQI